MAAEPTVKLRISVWRDFVPTRSLTVRRDGDPDHRLLSGDAHLQREVFSWQTREDLFAGVSDEEIRDRLREKLLALQLLYLKASESMGNHDSKVVDADSVD
jgi:hypothetical protein